MSLHWGVGLARWLACQAASGLVADGLLDFLRASKVDRQMTTVGPCIQVRPVDHEQLHHPKTIAVSSQVEGSTAEVTSFVPVRTLLEQVPRHIQTATASSIDKGSVAIVIGLLHVGSLLD